MKNGMLIVWVGLFAMLAGTLVSTVSVADTSGSNAPVAHMSQEQQRAQKLWVDRIKPLGLELPSSTRAVPLDATEAPSIEVSAGKVLLDERPVDDEKNIEDSQRLTRMGGLSKALEQRRYEGGVAMPGIVFCVLDERIQALVLKSLAHTAAFAGFPEMRILVRKGAGKELGWVGALTKGPASTASNTFDLVVQLRSERSSLIWRRNGSVHLVVDVPDRTRLVALMGEQWKQYGGHRLPEDTVFDHAYLSIENTSPVREVITALDAIHTPTRAVMSKGTLVQAPAFEATLSAN